MLLIFSRSAVSLSAELCLHGAPAGAASAGDE